MILALDTSTAACTAALFDEDAVCLGSRDEIIGRGHAERLAPMLHELLAGRRAQSILVGTGPGSFTGIRVGIAAAQGLAIGWNANISGMSSLGLIAAAAQAEDDVAAAMPGGHGELFAQQFGASLAPTSDLFNAPPAAVAAAISAQIVAGPGAIALVAARGYGRAVEAWPSASRALDLPEPLRALSPAPLYARPPDAKARTAA